MSRHRYLRQLTADYHNELAEEDAIDEDNDYNLIEEFLDLNDPIILSRLNEAVARVSSLLGPAFDETEIFEAVRYYSLNEEKAIRWLLEGYDEDEQKESSNSKSINKAKTTKTTTNTSNISIVDSQDSKIITKNSVVIQNNNNQNKKLQNKKELKKPCSGDGIIILQKKEPEQDNNEKRKKKKKKKMIKSDNIKINTTQNNDFEDIVSFEEYNESKQNQSNLKENENICLIENFENISITNISKSSISGLNKIDIKEALMSRSEHLTFVVAGHVDAGKSTILGHLLYLCGKVDERTMKKNRISSENEGRSSFAFAWVLDSNSEERARGVTIDVASAYFTAVGPISGNSKIREQLKRPRRFTVLDAPGHRDFVPNMLSGAARADAAVIVIDSLPGEFEKGHHGGGQTREHILLLKATGIKKLIVAINKMDSKMVGWSEVRYLEIKNKLSKFLRSIQFDPKDVQFIPCSGLSGHNLIDKMPLNICPWYNNGPTLLDALTSIKLESISVDDCLRITVCDHSIGGQSGNDATFYGLVTSGSVQYGDEVLLMPLGVRCFVRSISNTTITEEDDKENTSLSLGSLVYDQTLWAVKGDHVAVGIRGIDASHLPATGNVLCSILNPIIFSTSLLAEIVVFESSVPITQGFPIVFHQGGLSEEGYIKSFVSLTDKRKELRCLKAWNKVLIEVHLKRPICVEEYKQSNGSESRYFGRFVLRHSGETIASGKITKIINK